MKAETRVILDKHAGGSILDESEILTLMNYLLEILKEFEFLTLARIKALNE